MVARTLILIIITALVLVGFVFLAPLDVLLRARGYTPEQITTVKQAFAPPVSTAIRADAPAPPVVNSEPEQPAAATTKPITQEQSAATTPEDVKVADENKLAEQAPAPVPAEPAPARQFVATDTINVRSGQGTDTDVVGQLEPKTLVTVLQDPAGDWMQVESDSLSGWVYKPLFEAKE